MPGIASKPESRPRPNRVLVPPRHATPPGAGAHALARVTARLSPAEWTAVQREAARRGLTPSVVLLTAFANVLAAWSSTKHFVLTLANFARDAGSEHLVAQLADVMLVDLDLRPVERSFQPPQQMSEKCD